MPQFPSVTDPTNWFLAGAASTAVLCLILVITRTRHGRFSLDSTIGVQKFHSAPTPRVGGVAIYIGILVVLGLVPLDVRQLLMPMTLAALPAFVVGLWEDLTKRVSVKKRLLATFLSGVCAWWLTDTSLVRVDVPGIDWLLASSLPISVLFTAFAVSGASNAFNIIDGFNGLASGAALIALAGLALIAVQAGDQTIALLCLAVGSAVLGFMLINFPFGKIFLGDGGAYLVGFLVAWVAVMLPMRNPTVSVWATLLACGYPILETFFSIVRKNQRRGYSPGQPDHVHLHMLVFKRISRPMFSSFSPEVRNGLTSPLLWVYASIPASMAVLWYDSSLILCLGLALSALVYRLIYLRLTQFRWCFFTNIELQRVSIF